MRTTFSSLALASILALGGVMAGCQTQESPAVLTYKPKPPELSPAERRAAGYAFEFDTSAPNNNGRNNSETTVPDDSLGSGSIRIGLLFD